MATLQDLIVPKKTVLGVEVYALTIEDIAFLLKEHREAVKALFSNQDLDKMLLEFPQFISSLIARGTKSDVKVASKIPFGSQLELVVGIWEVSQINVTLLGKLMASVTTEIGKMSNLVSGKNQSLK